jgi:proteasome lid subunit RPN8/RPN11
MAGVITLTWDEATARTMTDAVRAAYPAEACGLLVGSGDDVKHAVPLENVASDPRRAYLIAPADLARVHGAAVQEGLEIVGVFHSHPDGQARLSASDLAQGQRGWLYVVVGTAGSEPSDLLVRRL